MPLLGCVFTKTRYWVAATPQGSNVISGVAPSFTNEVADTGFTILFGGCLGHGECDATQFCNWNDQCANCNECARATDTFDNNACPSRCLFEDIFQEGEFRPNLTETEASGRLKSYMYVEGTIRVRWGVLVCGYCVPEQNIRVSPF